MNSLTIKEAKDITLRYLIDIHGKEKGVKLFLDGQATMFDYHGLAWSLAKECLPYFCQIFLHDLLFDYSGDNIPLSKTHYEIWSELQDTMLNKNNTRNVYVLPRSFGKSTTITLVLACWTSLYCLHPFTVIQSATESQAQNFISSIKMQLEDNKYVKSCFGEIFNKNLKYNASEIELDIKPQRTKIQAVAAASSVRGINYGSFRIGLLLVDDGQDEKQITTDEACVALVSRFNNGIMKALQNKNNHVIALGTVQRKGDLYDELLNSPAWKARIEKCVLLDDIDGYFSNNQHWKNTGDILRAKNENPNAIYEAEAYYDTYREEMNFPLLWDNYKCFDLYMEWVADAVSFKRERQCDIRSLGTKRIHSYLSISAEEIEKIGYTKTILAVDPAATTNKKSDYCAFCVLSEAENHLKYARKLRISKMEFDEYINTVIRLLEEYTDINAIFVEKNVYMGADVAKLRELIVQHPALRNRTLTIINKVTTKNKDNRINAIIPDINMHRIIFNRDDYEAINQILEFAGTKYTAHDDAIDSLCLAIEYLPEVNTCGSYYFIPTSKVGIF